jgi:hypothetical protein
MPSFWGLTLMVAAFLALPTMICQLQEHKRQDEAWQLGVSSTQLVLGEHP